MLDIAFITEHAEILKLGMRKRNATVDLDKLLALEDKRTKGDTSVRKEWQKLMLQVPNMPDINVPDGADAKDNAPLKHIAPTEQTQPFTHTLLFTTFGVEAVATSTLITPHDIIAVGDDPNNERYVHVTDTQLLTPNALIPLFATRTPGGAISAVYTYSDEDTVREGSMFAVVDHVPATHQDSVMQYQKRQDQLKELFSLVGIPAEVLTACTGQLQLPESAATLYKVGERTLARVAYHHDFIARRLGMKHNAQLAHTVSLWVDLEVLNTHGRNTDTK